MLEELHALECYSVIGRVVNVHESMSIKRNASEQKRT